MNNILYVDGDFWTIDTMFYSIPLINNVAKYCYLFLSRLDMNSFNIGAAVPSMTVNILDGIDISLPTEHVLAMFEEQVSILFDQKKLLAKQNEVASEAATAFSPNSCPVKSLSKPCGGEGFVLAWERELHRDNTNRI